MTAASFAPDDKGGRSGIFEENIAELASRKISTVNRQPSTVNRQPSTVNDKR
jgi:hypothetical protein